MRKLRLSQYELIDTAIDSVRFKYVRMSGVARPMESRRERSQIVRRVVRRARGQYQNGMTLVRSYTRARARVFIQIRLG